MRSAFLVPVMSLILAFCVASGLTRAQDRTAIDPRQIIDQFDIFNDGDVLIVPVEIAGKTYRFLVVTGSTYTTFDTSLAGLLGAPIATSPTGPKWYLEPNGKVGNVSLQTGKPALIADMTRLRVLTGLAIDGVLGMSFLSTQVIHLDFDRGKLYFMRSSATPGGDSLPLHFDPQGAPVVDVEVPGAGKTWFRLDTGTVGCMSGNLDRWTFADLAGKGLMPRVAEIRAALMNGTEVNRRGEVRNMSLGPVSLPPLSLDESGRNELGLSFLRRFNVTFDFPGRRLYLAKSKCFVAPDRVFRSGLHPIRQYGDTIVAVISQGSPAEKSGIRPGDVIMEVAGKNAGAMRLMSLKLLFGDEGATVPVTIRRGQQQIPVTLHLGSWPLKQKEGVEGSQIIPPSDSATGPEQHGHAGAARTRE